MMFPIRLVALMSGIIAAGLIPTDAAMAQSYPVRPIRFIVPFPAGGANDAAARIVGDRLARALHQAVYIDNISGSGGIRGIEAAARSPADGYTVLIVSDALVVAPQVFQMTIDPSKELKPVIQLSRQPVVLAAHPTLNVRTVAELVSQAKQQPGIGYATAGRTSVQNIAAQWFRSISGADIRAIPYRGGGQAINDLIAGHVLLASLGASPIMPHYKSGAIRLLAQSTETRSANLPDVPTFQEAGIKGLVIAQWLGVFVPTGTPPDIAERLNSEINRALMDEAVHESFVQSAQDTVGGSAEAFAEIVREDFSKYGRLVKELNIRPD